MECPAVLKVLPPQVFWKLNLSLHCGFQKILPSQETWKAELAGGEAS